MVFRTTDDKLYRNDDDVWSVAVDGADIEAHTVTADAIVAGTITAAELAASAVTADQIAAGAVIAGKIATDAVTAGTISAGAVSADALAATLILASLIKTANSGNRVEFDSSGIRLYDASENLIVKIPTDGSDVYVNAQILATSLRVSGTATLDSDASLAPAAEFTLEGAVVAPTLEGTLSRYWPKGTEMSDPGIASWDFGGGYRDTAGGSGGATTCYVALVADFTNNLWKVVEWKISDGSVDRTTTLTGLDFGPNDETGLTLVAISRVGTSWYIAGRSDDYQPTLFKVLRSTGALTTSVDESASFYSGDDTLRNIATDGSSLLVAGRDTNNTLKVVTFDTSLAQTATKTLTGLGSVHYAWSLLYANEGAGALWYLGYTSGPTYYIQPITPSTGAPVSNSYWFTATGATQNLGMYWDGTNFYGLGYGDNDRPQTYKYSTLTSVTNYFYFTHAWYDSAGTTHETQVTLHDSPHSWNRREGFTYTVGNLPGSGGADEPNSARIYSYYGASLPAASSFDLQATGSGSISWEVYNSSGGAPNGGTAFPAAAASRIRNADDTLVIDSDGGVEAIDILGTTISADDFVGSTVSTTELSVLGPGPAYDTYTRGTSFPGSPDTGDWCYRTDLNMEFFYNGTRWLSTTLYTRDFQTMLDNGFGLTATTSLWDAPVPYLAGASDLWIEKVVTKFLVSGGTALSGSHKWVNVIHKRPTNDSTTTLATVTIDSGSLNVWREDVQTISALLNNGTLHYIFSHTWTKTGTPGTLYHMGVLTYRYVAT